VSTDSQQVQFGLAQAIGEIDADVLMLVEVGGRDSLENFNHHFLNEAYNAHWVEGNSSRSIDLGFLVRKGLSLSVEARSNRERPVDVHTLLGKFRTVFGLLRSPATEGRERGSDIRHKRPGPPQQAAIPLKRPRLYRLSSPRALRYD
jgi:hypothetical protein